MSITTYIKRYYKYEVMVAMCLKSIHSTLDLLVIRHYSNNEACHTNIVQLNRARSMRIIQSMSVSAEDTGNDYYYLNAFNF